MPYQEHTRVFSIQTHLDLLLILPSNQRSTDIIYSEGVRVKLDPSGLAIVTGKSGEPRQRFYIMLGRGQRADLHTIEGQIDMAVLPVSRVNIGAPDKIGVLIDLENR